MRGTAGGLTTWASARTGARTASHAVMVETPVEGSARPAGCQGMVLLASGARPGDRGAAAAAPVLTTVRLESYSPFGTAGQTGRPGRWFPAGDPCSGAPGAEEKPARELDGGEAVNGDCWYAPPLRGYPPTRLMRRFVLLILLAWLPIQASAMPWFAFKCEGHDPVVHEHAAPAGGHGHHAAGPGDAADGDPGNPISNAHSCCHQFSGAATALLQPTADIIAAGVDPHPLAHAYDFFPEPDKRPPLVALV